jgi:hypothetical protein
MTIETCVIIQEWQLIRGGNLKLVIESDYPWDARHYADLAQIVEVIENSPLQQPPAMA